MGNFIFRFGFNCRGRRRVAPSALSVALAASLATALSATGAAAHETDLRVYQMRARWQAPKVVLTYWYANWSRDTADPPVVRVYKTPDPRRNTPGDDRVVAFASLPNPVPGRAGFRPRLRAQISFDGPRRAGRHYYYVCFRPHHEGAPLNRRRCSPVRAIHVRRGLGPDLRVAQWRIRPIRQGPATVAMEIAVLVVNRGGAPSKRKHLRLYRRLTPGARQTVRQNEWRGTVPAVPPRGRVWVRVQHRFANAAEEARRWYRVCAVDRQPPYSEYCSRRWRRTGR